MRVNRLAVRRAIFVSLSMSTLSACEGGPFDNGLPPADSLWVVEVSSFNGLLPDTMNGGIFLAASSGRLAVVPLNQSGILIIDSAAGEVRTVGETRGSGPGEFQAPVSLWYRSDSLMVYDRALARISVLGPDLVVTRSWQRDQSPDEIYGSPLGHELATARDRTLGSILAPQGGREIAQLPRTTPRAKGSIDRYAADASGRFFVYEATTGLIHTFDTTGAVVAQTPIPGWLSTTLLEQFDKYNPPGKLQLNQRFPEAKFLSADGRGGVWLFYYVDRNDAGFAVRFDPETQSFSKVGLPADSATAEFLKRGFAATIRDSLLFVSRPDGIRSFVIRGGTPR